MSTKLPRIAGGDEAAVITAWRQGLREATDGRLLEMAALTLLALRSTIEPLCLTDEDRAFVRETVDPVIDETLSRARALDTSVGHA